MLLSGQNDFYTLDDLCMATLGGKTADMASYLQRTLGEGQHPVMIARALQRHLMRLLQARGFMDDGQNIDAAMAQLRPPVFFKYVPVFKAVLQRWSARDINAGLKAMLEAELQFKSSLADVGLLCRHQLLALSSLPGSAARAA